MKSNKRWIAHAMKNSYGEGDINEKGKVARAFMDYFDLDPLINNANDSPVFINKVTGRHGFPEFEIYLSPQEVLVDWEVFYPDVFVKNVQPMIVCEIDGKVHWENNKAVARTNLRNACYESAGFNFVWLTDIEVREKSMRFFIENLAEKLGMKPRLVPKSLAK